MSTNIEKTVLYIPGFLSGNDSQSEMLSALRGTFPSSYNVSSLPWEAKMNHSWNFPWESETISSFSSTIWDQYLLNTAVDGYSEMFNNTLSRALLLLTLGPRWLKAVESTDLTADIMAQSLLRLPAEQREKIILVGHSLGACIVMKTLNKLSKRNACIWKAVLLGAAMNCDETIIRPACNAVKSQVISVINTEDYALGLYSLMNGQDALGSGYHGPVSSKRFFQITTDPIAEHASLFYIQQLKQKAKSYQ